MFYSPAICTTAHRDKEILITVPNRKFVCNLCRKNISERESCIVMAHGPEINPPMFVKEDIEKRMYIHAHGVCWYAKTVRTIMKRADEEKSVPLISWAVYNESDKPGVWPFSARAFIYDQATNFVIVSTCADQIRSIFEHVGLFRMVSAPGTEEAPEIIECWL